MNVSEMKKKVKNKEKITYKEILEMVRSSEGRLSAIERLSEKGRTRSFIKNDIGSIMDLMNEDDQMNLILYNADIPEIQPQLRDRIIKVIEGHAKDGTLIKEKTAAALFATAYPMDKEKESGSKVLRDFIEKNGENIIRSISVMDYKPVFSMLRSDKQKDEYIKVIKENYSAFLDELSHYSINGSYFFNHDKEFANAILSRKFTEFFDGTRKSGQFDELFNDEVIMETLESSEALKKEVIELSKQKFESGELESTDFMWFTRLMVKFDVEYLNDNMDSIVKILPVRNLDRYLEILERNPNSKKTIDVLEKYSEKFVTKTYTPLETLKKITKIYEKASEGMDEEEKRSVSIKKLREIVNSRSLDVAYEITGGIIETEDRLELTEKMIQELAKNEGKELADTEFLGKGSYSRAYKIGEKVIKVGFDHHDYSIPKNNRRILQPLVRTEDVLVDGRKTYFEIAELCDTSKPASKEETYQVYKELREHGIIWGDARPANLGRLKKPNRVYLDSIGEVDEDGKVTWGSKSHAGKAAGIEETEEDQEILGAGELVILDLDFLYREDDKNIKNWSTDLERRYQEEKKQALEAKKDKNSKSMPDGIKAQDER